MGFYIPSRTSYSVLKIRYIGNLCLMLKTSLASFLRIDRSLFHHGGNVFLLYLAGQEILKAVSNDFPRVSTFDSGSFNVPILLTCAPESLIFITRPNFLRPILWGIWKGFSAAKSRLYLSRSLVRHFSVLHSKNAIVPDDLRCSFVAATIVDEFLVDSGLVDLLEYVGTTLPKGLTDPR